MEYKHPQGPATASFSELDRSSEYTPCVITYKWQKLPKLNFLIFKLSSLTGNVYPWLPVLLNWQS